MAAKGGDLKLLGVWDSPYVNRVQIVLNLKGLTYEYVEEDLLHKSDLLLDRVQPRAQESPRAHPRRQAHRRVAGHRPVPRRDLRRRRPVRPPRRPVRPRHRPLLGRLCRRQGGFSVVHDPVRAGGREEGRRGGADHGGAGDAGGRVQGLLPWEGLLRRRRHRVRGRRAGQLPRVVQGVREDGRRQGPGRGEDAAPGGVGRAVRRSGRGKGRPAGRR